MFRSLPEAPPDMHRRCFPRSTEFQTRADTVLYPVWPTNKTAKVTSAHHLKGAQAVSSPYHFRCPLFVTLDVVNLVVQKPHAFLKMWHTHTYTHSVWDLRSQRKTETCWLTGFYCGKVAGSVTPRSESLLIMTVSGLFICSDVAHYLCCFSDCLFFYHELV